MAETDTTPTKVVEEFRTALAQFEQFGQRMTEAEKKLEGVAYEKELREKVKEDLLGTIDLEQYQRSLDAVKARLDEIEIEANRPAEKDEQAKASQEYQDRFWDWFSRKANAVYADPPEVMKGWEQKANAQYRRVMVRTPSAQKDMTVDTDTAAGFLVHPDLREKIIAAAREFDVMRQLATVVPVDGNELVYPKRTGNATAAYLGKEAGTATEDSTEAYGQVRIPCHEAMSYWDASWKLLAQSFVDFPALASQQFGDAFATLFGESYINGDDAGEPRGFLADSNVQANYRAGGKASTLASDSAIIKVMTDIKQPYWQNCVWVMNRTTLGVIYDLRDGQGRTVIADNLNSAMPLSIRGKPIYISPNMPDIDTDAFAIAYGDFKRGYVIADTVQMAIQRDDVTQAGSATTRFYGYAMSGGDVADDDAIYTIKIAES